MTVKILAEQLLEFLSLKGGCACSSESCHIVGNLMSRLNYIATDFNVDPFYPLNLDNNSFLVYCRELAPDTVSLTGDRAQGDDDDLHYTVFSM